MCAVSLMVCFALPALACGWSGRAGEDCLSVCLHPGPAARHHPLLTHAPRVRAAAAVRRASPERSADNPWPRIGPVFHHEGSPAPGGRKSR